MPIAVRLTTLQRHLMATPLRKRVGTVGAAVVAALADAGIDAAFGMDDPQGLWSALRPSPIRTVVFHDERSAGFAATGYALAARRVCLCTGITGPGGTNLATPMLEAQKASIAMLFLIGEANPARPDLHGFQTAPHEEILAPLAKDCVRIGRGDGPAAAVHRAVNLATGGRPGPVLLLVDDDLLWEDAPPARPAKSGPTPASQAGLSLGGPAADRSMIAAIYGALTRARRPVIVAGGGVLLADATEQLRAVAEKYRVPVATTVVGKGALADTHPLALGVGSSYTGGIHGIGALANRCLGEADTIMVVGSDLDPLTTSAGSWPDESTELIRIDVDPTEVSTHPGLHILGDARTILEQLSSCTPEVHIGTAHEKWIEEVTEATAAHRKKIRDLDLGEWDDGYVWPGEVMQRLSQAFEEGDAIVTDASFSSSWAIDRIEQRKAGRCLFGPRGSGVLGWGLPAALGIKFLRPDSTTTCVTGDGGLHYSIGEMETAVRMNLPIVLVVLNNRSLGFQRQSDRLHEGQDYADLRFDESVDYVAVGRGFGWDAVRADTGAEFESAYRRARQSKAPTLIEVSTDPDTWAPITKFDGLLERGLASGQMVAVAELEDRDG